MKLLFFSQFIHEDMFFVYKYMFTSVVVQYTAVIKVHYK